MTGRDPEQVSKDTLEYAQEEDFASALHEAKHLLDVANLSDISRPIK